MQTRVMSTESSKIGHITTLLSEYAQLMKLRLSFLVVFSAIVTYLYAGGAQGGWMRIALLFVGGFLVTGASNTMNQVLEKDLDGLMERTRKRPLPAHKVKKGEAYALSAITGLLGLVCLYFVDPLCAALGAFAYVSYAFFYTPLKQVTSFAVFVGAIPGAMPPLLGWVAATGQLSYQGWVLFGIQFFWQFPHFWSIAWVLDEDYRRANFHLLPFSGFRDHTSALWIVILTAMLVAFAFFPYLVGMNTLASSLVCGVTGTFFFFLAIQLFRKCSIKAASHVMFASFIYLPVVQLVFLIDKLWQ